MIKLLEIKNKKNYMLIFLFIIFFLISGCDTKIQDTTKSNIDVQITSTNNNLNINQTNDINKELNKVTTIDPITKNNINKTDLDINIISFKSDKKVYSSRENISFFIKIESTENINGIVIDIKGVKSSNHYYIRNSEVVNLKKGKNKFEFSTKTPSCTSGCFGVNPGTYKINIELLLNNLLLTYDEILINLTK
jgi:hypothetical protein